MGDYIDREAAISAACKGCNKEFPNGPCEPADCYIQQGIFKIPAADVVEVRHGEWMHTDKAFGWHSKDECSECHYHSADRFDLSYFNYCPSCGAQMDGKGEGE